MSGEVTPELLAQMRQVAEAERRVIVGRSGELARAVLALLAEVERLTAAVAEAERRGAVEALREAAEAIWVGDIAGQGSKAATNYLLDRAAHIESETEGRG